MAVLKQAHEELQKEKVEEIKAVSARTAHELASILVKILPR